MSRPAIVYLCMIVVLIAGLWLVLEIGGSLMAPEDLAGKWQLQPTDNASFGPALNIEQSGKFFQVEFEHGPQLDLELQTRSPMVLVNNDWKLTVTGHVGSDEKSMQLEGPHAGHWAAHRVVRAFPLEVTTREAD